MRGHHKGGFADSDRFLDRLQRGLDQKGAENRKEAIYEALGTTRKQVGLTPGHARAILALIVERS